MSTQAQIASDVPNRKHGFRGDFSLAPAENRAEWEQLQTDLVEEWQPVSETERNLVQMLAENFWLRKRAQMLATVSQVRTDVSAELQMKLVEIYTSHANRHERAYHKCRKELEVIRKEREKEAIGFERQIAEANKQQRRQQIHEVKLRIAEAQIAKLQREPKSASNVQKPTPHPSQAKVTVRNV